MTEPESPRYEAILPQHLDSTMLSAFRSCPRKFYHEFVLGLRPADVSVDLHAGAAFATALEHFYAETYQRQQDIRSALASAAGKLIVEYGDFEPIKDTPKTLDRMLEALTTYVHTFPPARDHVQPYSDEQGMVTSEFSFAVPLDFPGFPMHPSGEPFIYCGRFDMLGSYLSRPCVRDEKTTKYAGPTWSEQWDLRAQFMGYVWGCQQYGIPLDTVVVRGIVIQKTQIKILEAIKIYPSYMVERWFTQLRRDVTRLRACWDDQYFDYNLGDACNSFGRCPFTSVCQSNNQENWMQEYKIKRWNPLDRNPIEPKKEAVAA